VNTLQVRSGRWKRGPGRFHRPVASSREEEQEEAMRGGRRNEPGTGGGRGGGGGGNEREREVGSGQPATRCWMAENVTVDAPKLNLPGNAERLIKCVRQGASRPSAALSLAISPALVFFFFFFFFFDRFRWESTAVSLSPGRLGRTDSLKPSRSSFSSS